MELFPELNLGWLNGWLVIALLGLTDGILFLVFPKEVVRRLWDRSGWSPKQQAFYHRRQAVRLGLISLTHPHAAQIGSPVFVVGALLSVFGLIGLVKALFDFKNTPLDEPVTRWPLSRFPPSSNRDVFAGRAGGCIAIGSWVSVFFWAAARLLAHFGILAEEQVCLKQYGEPYRAYLGASATVFYYLLDGPVREI